MTMIGSERGVRPQDRILLENQELNPDTDVFLDNKTMKRGSGFLRFWDGESNPAARLSQTAYS